jgi:signal transduction histidine kinase/DNA-binding NarL/FixJ family response regulator
MGKSFQETEKLRILIIEDDLRYRSIVSQSLPECEKSFANDPEVGWSLFTQVAPDIVFLDLTFPEGLSGLTLLKKIRDFDPKSYVVIITASQMSADFNTAMRLGASGYITKPFSTKSLSDYVKKYMALNPGNTMGITRRRLYEEYLEKLKLESRNQTTDESRSSTRFDEKIDQRFLLNMKDSLFSKFCNTTATEESLIDKRFHLPDLVSKWRVLVAAGDDVTIKNVTNLLEKSFLIKPDIAQNSDDALRMLLKGRYNMATISLKFHPKSGYHVVNEYIKADSRNPNATYLVGLRGDSLLDDTEKWQQAGLNAIINFEETDWTDEMKRLVVYYTREKAIFLTEHLRGFDYKSDHEALLRIQQQYETLSHSLTHIFSDPLRAILQSTVAMEESEKREAALKKLAEVKRWTTLSLKRLQGLSEYDHIQIAPPFPATSLHKLIQAVLKDLLPVIKKRGARIKTFGLFPDVFCHYGSFKKALYHLIKNGIDHNPSIPPIVGLSCQDLETEWVIKVQDNGTGIEKLYTDHIFSLFESLNAQTENAGVGLPIVKKIIELHGGRIWFESTRKGTVFYMSLPKNNALAGEGHLRAQAKA